MSEVPHGAIWIAPYADSYYLEVPIHRRPGKKLRLSRKQKKLARRAHDRFTSGEWAKDWQLLGFTNEVKFDGGGGAA